MLEVLIIIIEYECPPPTSSQMELLKKFFGHSRFKP